MERLNQFWEKVCQILGKLLLKSLFGVIVYLLGLMYGNKRV